MEIQINKRLVMLKISLEKVPFNNNFSISLDEKLIYNYEKKSTSDPRRKIIQKLLPGEYYISACLGECKIRKEKIISVKGSTVIYVQFNRNSIDINM